MFQSSSGLSCPEWQVFEFVILRPYLYLRRNPSLLSLRILYNYEKQKLFFQIVMGVYPYCRIILYLYYWHCSLFLSILDYFFVKIVRVHKNGLEKQLLHNIVLFRCIKPNRGRFRRLCHFYIVYIFLSALSKAFYLLIKKCSHCLLF